MSKLPVRAAKLSSLSDQIYEHLHKAIISAEIAPGEKLVELDIAGRMGTSQGPVREALQRLERDGLVERRARSATFVTSISTEMLYELCSVRSVIEEIAVRRLAQHITDEQYSLLDALVQKMTEAGGKQNLITLSEYDMQFHRSIVEWAGSSALFYAWMALSSQIQRFIIHFHSARHPNFVIIATRHQPILDALRQHDIEGAARALHVHIMLIWSELKP